MLRARGGGEGPRPVCDAHKGVSGKGRPASESPDSITQWGSKRLLVTSYSLKRLREYGNNHLRGLQIQPA